MSNYPDGCGALPGERGPSLDEAEGYDEEAADDAEHWDAFRAAREQYLTAITAIQIKMKKRSAKDLDWYIAAESDTYADNVAARIEECQRQLELGWELEP